MPNSCPTLSLVSELDSLALFRILCNSAFWSVLGTLSLVSVLDRFAFLLSVLDKYDFLIVLGSSAL